MKKLISVVVGLLLTLGSLFKGAAQTVQYVTVLTSGFSYSYGYLPLQTNQVVSCVGNNGYISQINGSSPSNALLPSLGSGTYTGLTNITIMQTAGAGIGVATFQITTPAIVTVISNYVPADAIVVPASATGNVQIILESSPDLVNWTAASPGTYGALAGTNRFFRVRAAAN